MMESEELQHQRLMSTLQHHLCEHIARASQKEVWRFLDSFFRDGPITTISKQQLEYYKQLEKNTIDLEMLKPKLGLVPSNE